MALFETFNRFKCLKRVKPNVKYCLFINCFLLPGISLERKITIPAPCIKIILNTDKTNKSNDF